MGEDMQKILYENFIKSLGDEVLEVPAPKPPEVGQVRLYLMTPPEYILITEKVHEDLFKIVPLTSYVQLAITNKYPPTIRWRGFLLVPLPFEVYAEKTLLEKHSEAVFKVSEGLEKIAEYVKTVRIRGIGKWREKFIEKNIERWKDINLSSIVASVIRAEEGKTIVIRFRAPVSEDRETKLAARSQGAFRGSNWIGVLEEGRLYMYLSEDLVGRRIRISYRGEVLYEGPASLRFVVEDVPETVTDLEEGLNVQVLGDRS
ncbi:MAG: hypothetical protein Q9N26_08180 [Aquificota bacterium]|nr:hypothetical protein [Aquificota bacterium]